MMAEIRNQDFEIVAIDHPDYKERIDAVDGITDFKILEEIFITDDYITVRAKALDRITELYGNKSKYRKMLKMWREMTGFRGWIHFVIDKLGRGNNIEKTIRYILEKRGYPFENFWNRWYNISKTRNNILSKVVDVMLMPIKSNEYYSRDGIEVRWTNYGIQYHYEMVIKILSEKDNHELFHEYVYIMSWNSNPDTHKKLYKKINYEEV